MSFLSGILGALGGPTNIIKSVGEFVGDSLSSIASGKPVGESLLKAGSSAVNKLIGREEPKRIAHGPNRSPHGMQITNSRPTMMNTMQVNRGMHMSDMNLANKRHAFILNGRQPAARMTTTPIYKAPKPLDESQVIRGTNAGFPGRKYYVKGDEDVPLSKRQMKKMRRRERENIEFKNYME